ncbi:MAG: HAD family hydrolase [Proteobacteria bacterium]|nr:HAD family hydrolase [Pseudomonadota bacterium]
MRALSAYGLAVFDCDGVVLDSNRLKSEALAKALADEPAERVAAFVRYHQATGGVSRYEKFRHYYAVMSPRADVQAAVDGALARLAGILRDELVRCPEVPGVRRALERLRAAGVPCAVNSGGDEAELLAAFPRRGLDAYFAAVLGSPRTKAENMERLREKGLLRLPGLYFGDARKDMETAEAYGFDFVFVSARSDWADGAEAARARGHGAIADFDELLARAEGGG